jgi:ABC-type lipoprotein export system ATPase subunit
VRLTLTGVSVAYGATTAVHPTTLSFESGQVCALRGPSGSGKSTLLGVISGQLQPSFGDIRFDGLDEPHVQWVFQSSPMLDRRTVLDNVVLAATARGLPSTPSRRHALELLHDFGLGEMANRRAYTLSGGQRQRAAIARAIIASPDVLLADEPTSSLDATSRELVCDALERAASGGALVVVATHDDYVAQRCHRVENIDLARTR